MWFVIVIKVVNNIVGVVGEGEDFLKQLKKSTNSLLQ